MNFFFEFKKKMGWFIFIFKKKYLLENYTLKFKKKLSKSILFYLFNYELKKIQFKKKTKKEDQFLSSIIILAIKFHLKIKINMTNY